MNCFSKRITGVALLLPIITCSANAAGDLHTLSDVVVKPSQSYGVAAPNLEPSALPSVVDVGIFYALEFRDRNTSLAELDVVADRMVDFTNAALAASSVPLTLRIAYATEFGERLDGLDPVTAFGLLDAQSQQQRDTVLTDFGVDAVILIKATDDVDTIFGVADLGTLENLTDPLAVPVAVVCLGPAQTSGAECFGSGGIFAHEVGHLFGAGHQRSNASGGAFEYSYASECGGGTIVYTPVTAAQQIYSTPAISVNNEPCGVPASAGPDGEDNAHTIDLTRSLVASLRATMPIFGTVMIDSPMDYTLSEGGTPVTAVLRRDGDLTERAGASISIISGLQASADILIEPADIIFEPGQDSVTISIAAIDDAIVEASENFTLALRNPWRLQNNVNPAQVTVLDNDVAPPNPPPTPAPRSSGGGALHPAFLALLIVCLWGQLRRGHGTFKPGVHSGFSDPLLRSSGLYDRSNQS